MITFDLLEEGYRKGLIKLMKSPVPEYKTACSIGSDWLPFGDDDDHLKELSPEQCVYALTENRIINELFLALNSDDFRETNSRKYEAFERYLLENLNNEDQIEVARNKEEFIGQIIDVFEDELFNIEDAVIRGKLYDRITARLTDVLIEWDILDKPEEKFFWCMSESDWNNYCREIKDGTDPQEIGCIGTCRYGNVTFVLEPCSYGAEDPVISFTCLIKDPESPRDLKLGKGVSTDSCTNLNVIAFKEMMEKTFIQFLTAGGFISMV